MTGIMGKWPSGYGQPTKIRLPDSCRGKTITMAVQFGYDRMDLKAIWEMSDKMFVYHFNWHGTIGGYLTFDVRISQERNEKQLWPAHHSALVSSAPRCSDAPCRLDLNFLRDASG